LSASTKTWRFTLYLLALPNQDLDLQLPMERGYSVLHLACSVGLLREVEALLALGAELEARDENGDLLLCIAAFDGHIPVVGCLLERYRGLGPAKLQEALDRPCKHGGIWSPLLLHVVKGDRKPKGPQRNPDIPLETQVSMLRHLVQEWKADVTDQKYFLLHLAAIQGCTVTLEFFFRVRDACGHTDGGE